MNDLRQELSSAEQELNHIRNEKDLLLNQLDFLHSNNSKSFATKTKSSSGFESIQERSEECDSLQSIPNSTHGVSETRVVTATPSDSNLFRHIWQIERIAQRDDGFFTSKQSNVPNVEAKTIPHTQSMQKIPILMNPMYAGFNNDSSTSAQCIGSAMLTSRLPLRKTISLELPHRIKGSMLPSKVNFPTDAAAAANAQSSTCDVR